ncbi:uncharacterized protein LOC130653822 [Hydractinia symbiolongicarpus]|uniref:uncharacterized protein LOC130653822 n=1 Tax=Hydractinia symbiolongicarpus TaxID=13093 RepID=UPI00254D006E|nr:uncharacterized protein LOC130653822 [Hydractinia symbiolongicarpus]
MLEVKLNINLYIHELNRIFPTDVPKPARGPLPPRSLPPLVPKIYKQDETEVANSKRENDNSELEGSNAECAELEPPVQKLKEDTTDKGKEKQEKPVKKRFRRIFRCLRLRKKVNEESLETPEVIAQQDNKKFKLFSKFFKRKKKIGKVKENAKVVEKKGELVSLKDVSNKVPGNLKNECGYCMSRKDRVRETCYNLIGPCFGVLKINVVDKNAPIAITGKSIALHQEDGSKMVTKGKTGKKKKRKGLKRAKSFTALKTSKNASVHDNINDEDRADRESEDETDSELQLLFAQSPNTPVNGESCNTFSPALDVDYEDIPTGAKRHVHFEIPHWDEHDRKPGSRCATPKPKEPSAERRRERKTIMKLRLEQIKAEEARLKMQHERIRPISARRDRVNKTKIDLKALEAERRRAQLEHMKTKEKAIKLNKDVLNDAKLEKINLINERAEAVRAQKEKKEMEEMERRRKRAVELQRSLASSKGRRNNNLSVKVEKLKEKHAHVDARRCQKRNDLSAQGAIPQVPQVGVVAEHEPRPAPVTHDDVVLPVVAKRRAKDVVAQIADSKKLREGQMRGKIETRVNSERDALVRQQHNQNSGEEGEISLKAEVGEELVVGRRRRRRKKHTAQEGDAKVAAEVRKSFC